MSELLQFEIRQFGSTNSPTGLGSGSSFRISTDPAGEDYEAGIFCCGAGALATRQAPARPHPAPAVYAILALAS